MPEPASQKPEDKTAAQSETQPQIIEREVAPEQREAPVLPQDLEKNKETTKQLAKKSIDSAVQKLDHMPSLTPLE